MRNKPTFSPEEVPAASVIERLLFVMKQARYNAQATIYNELNAAPAAEPGNKAVGRVVGLVENQDRLQAAQQAMEEVNHHDYPLAA